VVVFVGQVDDKVFDALGVAVRTKYGGPTAANAESLLLNVIMIQVCFCVCAFRFYDTVTTM